VIGRLRRRAEFLKAAANKKKWVAPGLILQARERAPLPSASGTEEPHGASAGLTDQRGGSGLRLGFTASKKVGNAVKRNRARRRLKASAMAVLGRTTTEPHYDLVLIARAGTLDRPYDALCRDLETGLQHLGVFANAPAARTKPTPRARHSENEGLSDK